MQVAVGAAALQFREVRRRPVRVVFIGLQQFVGVAARIHELGLVAGQFAERVKPAFARRVNGFVFSAKYSVYAPIES